MEGRLMALGEGGLPYALRVMCDGVVETLGKMSFDEKMQTNFTAHPKTHLSTGKLYGFGYQVREVERGKLLSFFFVFGVRCFWSAIYSVLPRSHFRFVGGSLKNPFLFFSTQGLERRTDLGGVQ